MPVVVADLHSALAPALLAIDHDRPGTRVVYVMTDQGALPLAFSRSVAELRDAGLLAGDGDRRAGVRRRPGGGHRALRAAGGAAGAQHADLAVVTQGPGNLGTGTRWGFSGVERRRGGQRRGDPRRPAGRRRCGSPGRTRGSGTAGSPITA